MVKEINNKELGKGEKHIKYNLVAPNYFNYLCGEGFDTKEELNKWIKKNKKWLNEVVIPSIKGEKEIKVVKRIEIYSDKIVGTHKGEF